MSSLSEQTANVHVDLDHFETFVEYARIIRDYVHYDLLGQTLAPDQWMSLENADGNPFGNFSEAHRMKQSVVDSRNAVTTKIREFEERINQLHTGLQEIAKNYKSVEELNRASAEKIKALFPAPKLPPQLQV